MLVDYASRGSIKHKQIIDQLSFNTKNDKAFSITGKASYPYMKSNELTNPRVKRSQLKEIILGGGQNYLSPERRLDAIIQNTPNLFE